MGIFQDFVTKIKNTFSSDDVNELTITVPYSFLPSIKEIKEAILPTLDTKLLDFDFLKVEIQLAEENVNWTAIIQHEEGEDIFYKKISSIKGVLSTEKTNIPFGFQPFSTIKNEAIDALTIIRKEVITKCFDFKLYFPLTPFDTEPLWFLGLENEQQAIVGADTGSLEIKE